MTMLIAWHTLNKLANPQDARFSDTFLIVTPGITIRDRLRVLLPNDPDNYYRLRDIVPAQLDQLGQAKIVITNFHAFQLREKVAAGKITKEFSPKDSQALSPRHPTRWSGASAASWAPRKTSSSSTMKPTTATAASPRPRGRNANRRRAQRSETTRRRSPHLDLGHRGRQSQDRRQGDLRPLRDPVLPARFGLPRRNTLSVGRFSRVLHFPPFWTDSGERAPTRRSCLVCCLFRLVFPPTHRFGQLLVAKYSSNQANFSSRCASKALSALIQYCHSCNRQAASMSANVGVCLCLYHGRCR